MNNLQPIKGTRDFYPETMELQRALYDTVETITKTFGYREYDAPLVESIELYEAKSSREIIEEQSYVFDDRGGRRLVLRPEMTPTLARMVVAKQRELPSVMRWYTIASCWRYERPQKGRLRNFFQLNLDLIGSSAPEADAEVIEVPLRILETLGADMSTIGVMLNDRELLDAVYTEAGVSEDIRGAVTSFIDRKAKMEISEWREKVEVLGVTKEQLEAIEAFLNMSVDEMPNTEAFSRIKQIIAILTERGYGEQIVFDPSVVRGFDYYTSTVFEIFDTSGGFRRSVFGGGRYDKLIEQMGGKPMSTVGCAASIIAIQMLFAAQEREIALTPPARVMLIPDSEAFTATARQIANDLRAGDVFVVEALPPYDTKKELKRADKAGVTWVLLIKDKDQVVVRNMQTGEQQEVTPREVQRVLN